MARINAREGEEAEWEAKLEWMSEVYAAEWEAMSDGQRAEWEAMSDGQIESASDYVSAMTEDLISIHQEMREIRERFNAAEQPKWEVKFAKMVAHIEQHGRIPKWAWVRRQLYEGATRPVCEHYKNLFHEARVQMLEALPLWRCAKRAQYYRRASPYLSIAQAGGRRSGKRSWRMSLSTTRIMGTCRRWARLRPSG